MKSSHTILAIVGACAIFGTAASVVGAENALQTSETIPPANIQIVLDASGSMWGQIDGENKITIARQVVQDFLASVPPETRLGLTAYGHRRKGDCGDIEVLVPAASGSGTKISSAVAKINPKGKTPLTDAVRQAAEALRYEEEKATVILVTDGLETCQADPCALSARLEKDGVDFTAHVIGFDVAKEETKTLQCIADNTGGVFLSANNADELKEALGTTIQKAVKRADNVGLQAVMAEGDDPIADHLYYYVYDAQTDEEVAGTNVAAPRVSLKPGRYRVKVRHGALAFAEKEITVPEGGELQDTIIMGTGLLAVKSKETADSDPVSSGPVYTVYQREEDGSRGEDVEFNNNAQVTFILPAGDYIVRSAWGAAVVDEAFSIQAGKTTDLAINLNIGEVKLSSTARVQGDILTSGTVWYVYEKKEDGARGAELDFNNNAQVSFRLSEGDYIVKAANKDAAVFDEISAKAGETVEHIVNLDMGWIKPVAILEGGEKASVCYAVMDAASGKEAAGNCADDPPRFGVRTGTYSVDFYASGKRVKSETFALSPGETREVRINFPD